MSRSDTLAIGPLPSYSGWLTPPSSPDRSGKRYPIRMGCLG
jgi:hypothetical protein